MTRLLIALVACAVTAACPAGKQGSSTAGATAESGGPALQPKKLLVSWGITQEGEMADVFLATTDETGKQVSHQIGRYKGTCDRITPAREMNALTGVACVTGGGGTEIHAVHRADEIVVVHVGTTPGVAPDPMARKELTRVKVPVGVAVEAAP
jgi:hypothetical protein